MSKRLTRCADSFDICFGEDRNEYKEDFEEMMKRTRRVTKEKTGIVISHVEFTPEEQELRDNYFRRCKEIEEADQKYREDTYRWIGEDLGRMWD